MSAEPDVNVVDNRDQHRFQADIDGAVAILTYKRADGRLLLKHTEVPDALEGRGIGGRLVRAAVEAARAEGLAVVPACSFAAAWLGRHPDEAATVTVEPPPEL